MNAPNRNTKDSPAAAMESALRRAAAAWLSMGADAAEAINAEAVASLDLLSRPLAATDFPEAMRIGHERLSASAERLAGLSSKAHAHGTEAASAFGNLAESVRASFRFPGKA